MTKALKSANIEAIIDEELAWQGIEEEAAAMIMAINNASRQTAEAKYGKKEEKEVAEQEEKKQEEEREEENAVERDLKLANVGEQESKIYGVRMLIVNISEEEGT